MKEIGFYLRILVFLNISFHAAYSKTDIQDGNVSSQKTNLALPPRTAEVFIGENEAVERAIFSVPLYAGIVFQTGAAAFELSSFQLAASSVAGWLGADLISGLIHVVSDNLSVTKGPEFLIDYAKGVQEHHVHPNRVVHDSFWFQNRPTHLAALPFLALAEYYRQNEDYVLSNTVAFAILFSAFSHFIHACAHGRCADSLIVKFFQDCGLFLSKETHRKHHKGDDLSYQSDDGFCLVNGYMEPVVSLIYSGSKLAYSGYNFVANGLSTVWTKFW